MNTFHIHIEGQVQGVGFRPFVYQLAHSLGLKGTVSNGMDGVHIFFNGNEGLAQNFYQKLLVKRPQRAKILRHALEEVAPQLFAGFDIVESRNTGRANLLLTPDFGLCDDCRQELHDPADRRFGYPFITCINCGPRYSITRRLPYDRERTAMAPYTMCHPCQSEYDSPLTRRHFSQTNSCPDCAVELSFWAKNDPQNLKFEKSTSDSNDCISLAVNYLTLGKILAVKGIGGYLLICDATNPVAVATLRERKHRPSKPFALMYPNLDILQKDAHVNDAEAAAFGSIESPIVLCRLREIPASGIDVDGIAPHLHRIGAMQPYTPLMELLLSNWQKPIVATSGNLSGSPIFFEDEKALKYLGEFVDGFIVNNRKILLPQDDSVVQFTPGHLQRIVLRRSRGYAPTYIHQGLPDWQASVLAMGADMKGTFSLQHAGNTYISQYLGDLESFDTQENFEKTLRHLLHLLDARPARVIVDKHPAYFSTFKGTELAGELGVALEEVQHHLAHFAAVLAENELLTSKKPVLGVIWDGTGWGDDGQVWGGEFFLFENSGFDRIAHLDYFPHFLGDKMAREPRLSALALFHDLPEAEPLLRHHFTEKEWAFYQKMLARPSSLKTSSVGRLFDGVAALLGLQSKSSFEGEAAMRLEALAMKDAKPKGNFRLLPDFSLNSILTDLIADLLAGVDKSEIAFHFHFALVHWIGEIARQQGVHRLAFSGGVFQNSLLTDLIISELGEKYELFFHQELSPNDECISFGQLAFSLLSPLTPEGGPNRARVSELQNEVSL
ncbi:MAG: carbamoyltransferase HypF [Lewinellaceae bacterium]|nr:carbamoyltransferase HypF [Saprospiraceae bacterium]MCB9340424.1 carbamoyltransferase HypF [Lewinellaceae bacterium]